MTSCGAWATALQLAWEAFRDGTTPVGAAVVDAGGTIVSTGRGRRYSTSSVDGQLSSSHLAHAELNALAQLSPERRYEDHVLLTTLEPCLLCVGAAVMTTVGRVEYAGADPYGGAAGTTVHNAHTARLMPVTSGPASGATGAFGMLLHYAFYFDRNRNGAVVAAHDAAYPQLLELAHQRGLVDELLDRRRDEPDHAVALSAVAAFIGQVPEPVLAAAGLRVAALRPVNR